MLLATAGVGLLAVDALVTGVWVIFFKRAFYSSLLKTMREVTQDQVTLPAVCGIGYMPPAGNTGFPPFLQHFFPH